MITVSTISENDTVNIFDLVTRRGEIGLSNHKILGRAHVAPVTVKPRIPPGNSARVGNTGLPRVSYLLTENLASVEPKLEKL